MANLLTNNADTYSSLSDWDSSYPTEYTNDLTVIDSLGKTIEERLNMYSPMYYLLSSNPGYRTSDVADYFRINTGIAQGDTSNVVEMNLYLALLNYGKTATFTTVWNQGHVKAERTGTANAEINFISWINEIEGVNNEDYDDENNNVTTSKKKKNYDNYIKFNNLLFCLQLLLLLI